MAPTIRVDEEVWEWLKENARPFEDTPNSVLRRVAGIDKAPTEARKEEDKKMTARLGVRITGRKLAREFGLSAKHSLYHKDGTFFERLTNFPGVLCDSSGYVMFGTREEFERDPRVSIGLKVNIPSGLSSHPRYRRFPDRRG